MKFIKRRDHLYAVTCKHVNDALKDAAIAPGGRFPTIVFQTPYCVLNFFRLASLFARFAAKLGGYARTLRFAMAQCGLCAAR